MAVAERRCHEEVLPVDRYDSARRADALHRLDRDGALDGQRGAAQAAARVADEVYVVEEVAAADNVRRHERGEVLDSLSEALGRGDADDAVASEDDNGGVELGMEGEERVGVVGESRGEFERKLGIIVIK